MKSLILLRLLVLPVSGEELSCALGLRVFNHIARRALLDDHAAVHEDHAACDIAGKRHFVWMTMIIVMCCSESER